LNFGSSQEIPPSDPVDQGDGDVWETVGEPAERSRRPAPTIEELALRMTQRSTRVVEPRAPAVQSRPEPNATAGAEEPATAQAEEEAPAEAGLVDIASLLGTPTVTVVQSSL
jgi:hypothetical protein